MIKDKIKSLMKMYNKSNSDCAIALDMPYASFTNKLNQRGFKTEDLIKIGVLTNTRLSFIDKDKNPVVIFDNNDI